MPKILWLNSFIRRNCTTPTRWPFCSNFIHKDLLVLPIVKTKCGEAALSYRALDLNDYLCNDAFHFLCRFSYFIPFFCLCNDCVLLIALYYCLLSLLYFFVDHIELHTFYEMRYKNKIKVEITVFLCRKKCTDPVARTQRPFFLTIWSWAQVIPNDTSLVIP